jgi:hypothetical protein
MASVRATRLTLRVTAAESRPRPSAKHRSTARRVSERHAGAIRLANVPLAASDPIDPSWAHSRVITIRNLVDGEGIEWIVRELDAANTPGRQNARCLVFENHQLVRRIWHFPPHWGSLSDAALIALGETGHE